LIIGGLTILLFIFRAYQISDTPFLLLYHCSLNLDSLHRLRHFVHENLFSTPEPEVFDIKIFFAFQTAVWKEIQKERGGCTIKNYDTSSFFLYVLRFIHGRGI
jgi:hypothetical protein